MRANEIYVGVSYPALTWEQMIRCSVLHLLPCDGTAAPGKNPTLRQQSPPPHKTPALSARNSESFLWESTFFKPFCPFVSQADQFLYSFWK